jgi:hypothetical protein
MLRMPAEEERGGRYITMEGGGELRMDWIDEEQGGVGGLWKEGDGEGAEELGARRREGEGVGFKQVGWISDLAQPRAFESDSKLDWASCREGQVEIEDGFFFSSAVGLSRWGPICQIF